MSLYKKPTAVNAASERQYTAAGGEVQASTMGSWASAEIFPGGGNVDISLILFQVVKHVMQMDLHKTLYPF